MCIRDRSTIGAERVTAIGTLILQWSAQCRRCLDHTIGETEISINEVFERSASEGETFELPNNEKLDLKPMLTEQAILNLPLTALCSESCSGPSETKFLVSAADDNIGEKKDPRWAILDELQLSDELRKNAAGYGAEKIDEAIGINA